MATTRLQIYVDKEDISSLNTPGKIRHVDTPRPTGKTFNFGGLSAGKPRKALGDVNTRNVGRTPSKGLQPTPQKPKSKAPSLEFKIPAQPASRQHKSTQKNKVVIVDKYLMGRFHDLQEKTKGSEVQKPQTSEGNVKLLKNSDIQSWMLEEDIEKMHVQDKEEIEDFRDLWPLEDQPVTHLEKMLSWRPAVLFPSNQIPCKSDILWPEEDDFITMRDKFEDSVCEIECLSEEDLPGISLDDLVADLEESVEAS